jgi:hypothetical protein
MINTAAASRRLVEFVKGALTLPVQIAVFVAIAALLLWLAAWAFALFVNKFGVAESRLECRGSLADDTRGDVFLKVHAYRDWMFWTESGGYVIAESTGGVSAATYYPKVRRLADLITFSESEPTGFSGHMSMLSGDMSLKTRNGWFEGRCKPAVSLEP